MSRKSKRLENGEVALWKRFRKRPSVNMSPRITGPQRSSRNTVSISAAAARSTLSAACREKGLDPVAIVREIEAARNRADRTERELCGLGSPVSRRLHRQHPPCLAQREYRPDCRLRPQDRRGPRRPSPRGDRDRGDLREDRRRHDGPPPRRGGSPFPGRQTARCRPQGGGGTRRTRTGPRSGRRCDNCTGTMRRSATRSTGSATWPGITPSRRMPATPLRSPTASSRNSRTICTSMSTSKTTSSFPQAAQL